MKKIIFSFILLIVSGLLFAQKTVSFNDFNSTESVSDENEVKTLMNSFTVKRISGFGASSTSISKIDGDVTILSGGGGGIIINNFFFGAYGEGSSINSNLVYNNEQTVIQKFSNGGFWLGYEIAPERIIHPVLSTRLGWGKVKGYDNYNYYKEKLYVVIPTITAEINITRFCKVNIGAEYRQTIGANIGTLKDSNLSNLGVYTNLIFGWF